MSTVGFELSPQALSHVITYKTPTDYVRGPIYLHGEEARVDVMIESKAKELALLRYRQVGFSVVCSPFDFFNCVQAHACKWSRCSS